MKKNANQSRFPLVLFGLYLAETILLGIAPVDREVWFAEGMTAWIPLLVLVVLYMRNVRFSNTAYGCMAIWFFLHTVGGHYTFEQVPFDWVTRLFGFERNHFDRICHFSVGGFAFPVVEYLETRRLVRGRGLVIALTVMSIFGFAAIFELVEWIYAECADPAAGAAFLGSQGDLWDAQKDMLADGLGAIAFSVFYALIRRSPRGRRFIRKEPSA